jgi:hypothetical protein
VSRRISGSGRGSPAPETQASEDYERNERQVYGRVARHTVRDPHLGKATNPALQNAVME